jgi:FAD/FMN-containing dehydrogenase
MRLRRRESCVHIEECLDRLDDLIAKNRMFDFYWYPRSEEAKLREVNATDLGPNDVQPAEGEEEERVGWPHEVIPSRRELRFHEMGYALPAEAGPACLREVRERIKSRHRTSVGWRVLYRTVAADKGYLSPAHGRYTHTISLHQNQSLPYRDFFADIEPIFRKYEGRAHWAKVHTQRPEESRAKYARWDDFLAAREHFDPDGVFLSPYLRELFGLR